MLVFDINYHIHKTLSVCDIIAKRKCFSNKENLENDKNLFGYKFLLDLFYDFRNNKSEHVVICADSSSWRKQLSTQYKESRPNDRMFDELFLFTDKLQKILVNEFGFTYLKSKGLEADDLIMLVTEAFDYDSVIITGDKDILQLANSNRKVFYKPKKEYHDNHGIIPFDKLIFGDKSDEIDPVVPRATRYRKKITTLLEEYNQLSSQELNEIVKTDSSKLIQGIQQYVKDASSVQIQKGLEHNARMIFLLEEHIPSELIDNLGEITLNQISKNFHPSKDTIAYCMNKV